MLIGIRSANDWNIVESAADRKRISKTLRYGSRRIWAGDGKADKVQPEIFNFLMHGGGWILKIKCERSLRKLLL